MDSLEFRGVTRYFEGGVCAVRDISFTAPAGQLTTLLGPSGCGKSTLLRIAAGLELPTRGSVYLGGKDIAFLAPEQRSITLLFQADSLFPHLDVIGNVSFGLRQARMPPELIEQRALKSLDLVGLHGFESKSCAELSGGEQQRVGLARALALQPSVVLLDEPLSNLDDRLRRQMREEIRSLQRRLGLTVVYVTHDESEAMAVSDLVVVMNAGVLLQTGTPRDVYEHPNCEFVAGFMGDATLVGVTVSHDGTASLGPLRMPHLDDLYPAGAFLRVMVRPEAWRVQPVGTSQGLAGRVLRCAYLGHGAEYLIDTQLGALLVTTRVAEAMHQPGAPVNLTLAERGVSVLSATTPDAHDPARVNPVD